MRLLRHRRIPEARINMAPMIDVVFLLIIFFMAVSQFTRLRLEPMDLPEADSGERIESDAGTPLVINVDATGGIAIDGEAVAAGDLPARLERWRAGRSTAALPPAVIRAEKTLAWAKGGAVLEACARQGIRVRVAVREPRGREDR